MACIDRENENFANLHYRWIINTKIRLSHNNASIAQSIEKARVRFPDSAIAKNLSQIMLFIN